MSDKLERLKWLTEQMSESLDEVSDLTTRLKNAKEDLRRFQEDIVPEAMRETGQDLLKLPNGQYLSLEDEIKARIPKAAEEEAYAYLEDIGEGGMLKRRIVCEFRRDQEAEALAALEALRHAGFHQAVLEKTHAWNTLQSWVEKQLEAGSALPLELFGIHQRSVAKVKVKP